jgi:Lar family restriction alleviation protein
MKTKEQLQNAVDEIRQGYGMEVNPCPFCGSAEIMCYDEPSQSSNKTLWKMYCLTCQGAGPIKYNFKDALNAWNNRKKHCGIEKSNQLCKEDCDTCVHYC